MSNKIIRAALESRLKTWAQAQSPPIPIAYQNVAFTPPSQARYLRAFLLPAETRSEDVPGETRTYMGIFQVSICIPDGAGAGAAETILADLETLFPVALRIESAGVSINIPRPVSASPAMNEPGLFVLPASIRYRADK